VIAAHIVDDSFINPEAGMSAGDHLASGVVTLVALVIAAAAAVRLRQGGRGALVLAFGVFGLAAGAEGAWAVVDGGLSRDDYTGLLALVAGLLLLTVGVRTLWHSRRTEGGRVRRYARRTLIGLVGIVVAFHTVVPVAFSYAATHAAAHAVPDADLGASVDDVTLRTSDGLQLSGWYVPSTNGAAVIIAPGRSGTQNHARLLLRHGYGVLVFDPRGEGESEGEPNAWGWGGERDLAAAVSFLQSRPDVDDDRIGGLGLSVGGEMLLHEAAQNEGLRAVVSEGAGWRSVREHMVDTGISKWAQMPVMMALTASTAVFTNQMPPPSVEQLVGKISPRPVLLIHATAGQAGEHLNPAYLAAAGANASIWEITDGGHIGGLRARPSEYEQRIIGFFDEHL
jgi:uncharacterized protein